VKLRDHPLMQHRGVPNWPPVWTRARDNTVSTVRSEVGVLTFVHAMPQVSTLCYLVMEYDGTTYVGSLIFDDHAFCKQIATLLRLNLKQPITVIGDLEVGHTL
jgi:hypothetical protein